MKKFLTSTLFLLLFMTAACAQPTDESGTPLMTGELTGIWDWTEDADYHKSVVKIEVKFERVFEIAPGMVAKQSGGGYGSGTIIEIDKTQEVKGGYLATMVTAYHVVVGNDKGETVTSIGIQLHTGKKVKDCYVIDSHKLSDTALVKVWVPKDFKAIKLASEPAKLGDELEVVGFGGSSEHDNPRHWIADGAAPCTKYKIYSDTVAIKGDSGGAILNSDHELVGVVSGGWFWYDDDRSYTEKRNMTTTWPMAGGGIHAINKLLKGEKEPAPVPSDTPIQQPARIIPPDDPFCDPFTGT